MRWTGLVLCFNTCAALALAASPPQLDEILTRVRAESSEFQAAVPDFIANESMVSTRITGGKVRRRVTVESNFSCRKPASRAIGFIEAREVLTEDGKPAYGKKIKAPAVFSGGFSDVVGNTFAAGAAQFQTFSLAGTEDFNGHPAVVIAFATRPGQQGMGLDWKGTTVATTDTGKAWLDPDSLRVLRLERRFTGLPHGAEATLRVDFAWALLSGKSFWLPRHVEGEGKDRGATETFVADYTNYRKFGSSTDIKFDLPE